MGRSAVAYQPLANEIPENWSLYAVQIPDVISVAHMKNRRALKRLLKCAFLKSKKSDRAYCSVWTMCWGALAIKLAYMMEEQGMELVGVIEAGNFPSPRLPGKWFELWSKFFLGTVGYLIACTRKY